jgi:hypothetical protein
MIELMPSNIQTISGKEPLAFNRTEKMLPKLTSLIFTIIIATTNSLIPNRGMTTNQQMTHNSLISIIMP